MAVLMLSQRCISNSTSNLQYYIANKKKIELFLNHPLTKNTLNDIEQNRKIYFPCNSNYYINNLHNLLLPQSQRKYDLFDYLNFAERTEGLKSAKCENFKNDTKGVPSLLASKQIDCIKGLTSILIKF